MTTKWVVPKDLWKGETVAVLGSGPSMNQELADSLRQYPRVCARQTFRFAPDADMLVAIDPPALDAEFWAEAMTGFEGLRICGAECDDFDALFLHIPHEVVRIAEGHEQQFRNNGITAIRIAAAAGASRILLAGFDPELYPMPDRLLPLALEALKAELRAHGIEIEIVAGDDRP